MHVKRILVIFFIASYTDVKVCTLSSKNDIDDEYHHLLTCEYFKNERNTFIEARYTKHLIKHNFRCLSGKYLRNVSYLAVTLYH